MRSVPHVPDIAGASPCGPDLWTIHWSFQPMDKSDRGSGRITCIVTDADLGGRGESVR